MVSVVMIGNEIENCTKSVGLWDMCSLYIQAKRKYIHCYEPGPSNRIINGLFIYLFTVSGSPFGSKWFNFSTFDFLLAFPVDILIITDRKLS